MVASSGSSPSRKRSSTASSISTTASISAWRIASASAFSSSGTSPTSNSAPSVSDFQTIAFIAIRSTTPMCFASVPMGSWTASGLAPSRSRIISMQRGKSAPTRSILLTKQMRGTLYLSAWRHTVSDCGSTPATASNTAIAPSSTRSERSTSMVKSTWPGVSMMLMRWSRQKQVVAAEVMVMPRSCSCSIQSMVALPSWTSPIL